MYSQHTTTDIWTRVTSSHYFDEDLSVFIFSFVLFVYEGENVLIVMKLRNRFKEIKVICLCSITCISLNINK